MKSLAFAVSVAVLAPSLAWAHGGGLDARGCHNDTKRGDYHCHQGKQAGRSFRSEDDFLAGKRGARMEAAERDKDRREAVREREKDRRETVREWEKEQREAGREAEKRRRETVKEREKAEVEKQKDQRASEREREKDRREMARDRR